MRAAPVSFTRDALPRHGFSPAPPVTDMGLPDVVSNRRTVRINFNATTDIWHIEILLRVTEAVRIDNLYRGGVTASSGTKPVSSVLENGQSIPVNKLVTKSQA